MTMTFPGNPSRLGALILLWLLTQSKGRTHKKLSAALKPLLEHQKSDAEQAEAIEGEVSALEQAGLLVRVNRSGLNLTEEGRQVGLAVLGMPKLPPRTTWKVVKERYLVALSLGQSLPLPAAVAKRLSDIEGVRAAILVHHYNIKSDVPLTQNQVKDVLAWRGLGVDTLQPFEKEPVRRFLLNQMLGKARAQSSDGAIEQLTAQAIGASRSDAKQILLTVQRRWMDGPEATLSAADTQMEAPSKVTTPPSAGLTDDNSFAARVLAAARAAKSGRFGDNKVFISYVFQRLKDEGAITEDLAAFKARLGAAHFRGLLSLSRADLVEAMAPEDVDASETQHEHATFHFVRI